MKAKRIERLVDDELVTERQEAGGLFAGDENVIVGRAEVLHRFIRIVFVPVRIRPALEEGCRLGGQGEATERYALDGIGEYPGDVDVLICAQLERGLSQQRRPGARGLPAHALEQRDDPVDRNEKADLVAGRAHVHADDPSSCIDRRPAAHSRIERTGEQDLRVEHVLERAVVRPLGDR